MDTPSPPWLTLPKEPTSSLSAAVDTASSSECFSALSASTVQRKHIAQFSSIEGNSLGLDSCLVVGPEVSVSDRTRRVRLNASRLCQPALCSASTLPSSHPSKAIASGSIAVWWSGQRCQFPIGHGEFV